MQISQEVKKKCFNVKSSACYFRMEDEDIGICSNLHQSTINLLSGEH